MSKSINISKGRQPWLFQFEVFTPYKNGFGISLKFTRQTGMIRILKITLWWYGNAICWFVFHCSVQSVFWAIHWWVYNKHKYTIQCISETLSGWTIMFPMLFHVSLG